MPEDIRGNEETWINIRKMAALDIVFHGPRLILAEFALTVLFCGIVGISSLLTFVRNPDRPLFTLVLGLVLSWIALNFLPLLAYAIVINRGNSARREVAFELEHRDTYARKYGAQSLLLLLPLIIPILAVTQEIQKRSKIDKQ